MAEYEIGRYYRVPAVLVNDWWGFNGWLPVIGPMHEDAEIVNFPWLHFHIDWRFAATEVWKCWRDHRVPGGHLAMPIQCPDRDGSRVINRGPEPRLMKYKRATDAFPQVHVSWRAVLQRKFACAKLVNGVCPHRGIPVSAMHREGDILTCPGHGLQWNAITGAAVQPGDKHD